MSPKLTCQIEITLTLCEPCKRAPCDRVGFGGQEGSNGLLVQVASSRVVSSLFADTGHTKELQPVLPQVFSVAEQRKNPAGQCCQSSQVHLVVVEYRNEPFGWTSAQKIKVDLRDHT